MSTTGFEMKPRKVDEEEHAETSKVVDFNTLVIPYENPLLKYDAVSWKFKLYTMSPTDLRKYQTGDTKITQLVISETGVTGKFNIDEVTVTTVPPGTNSTKNSSLMTMSITLSEQGSMSLFDELQAATMMLGYGQLMNVPLFLELTFVGYDASGINTPLTIPGTTKLWRIRLNKVDTALENTGGTTVYTMQCASATFMVPLDEWFLQENITMTANSTVKVFIEEFQKKLNAIIDTQYGYLTHMFAQELQSNNYFSFHVHPQVAQLILRNDPQKDTANDKSSNKQQGTRTYVFKAEDTVGKVLDYIMDSAQSSTKTPDTDKVHKRQFINVVPVSKYVGYDTLRKKHVYRYDVYVLPLRTLDHQDVDDTKNNNTAHDLKKLLAEANESDRFNMKRYDYQWSGLNNEILELNIDFNSSYNLVASRNLTSLFDRSNRAGIKTADFRAVDPIASPEEVQTLYLRKKELASKSSLTDEEAQELQQTQIKLDENTRIEGDNEQAIRATSDNRAFLEDITKSVDITTYTNKSGTIQAVNVPVDYKNVTDTSSATNDSNELQTEVSKRLIRSNYYNDTTLMKMDMTVVGDPYWLGKSEHDTIKDLQQLLDGKFPVTDTTMITTNILNCEPCYLLNMYPSRAYNDSTGLATADPNGIFAQAVYRVQTIVSTFDSKGFTQELTAAIVTSSVNRNK